VRRRAKIFTPTSAIFLVALLFLAGWAVPTLIMRYRAASQLREDGFLYFDHRLVAGNPGIPSVKVSARVNISRRTLAAITLLQPRYVTVQGSSTITNLNFLAPLKSVETIDIESCPALEDVGGIRNLVSLQMLILDDCPGVHSIDIFSRLQSLHRLSLESCSNLRDLRALQQMPSLEQLYLSDCGALTTLDELPVLPKLRTLKLAGCKHLQDIRGVTRLPALEDLDLTDCVELQDVSVLFSLKSLERIYLSGCTNVPSAQIRRLTVALPSAEISADKPATVPGAE